MTINNAGSAAVSTITGYHQFAKGGAILQVNTQVALTLIGAESLDDVLTGTSAGDTILGLGGNDQLTGNGGNDTLNGGKGNDTYVVGSQSETVTEVSGAGSGTDTVQSSASYSLAGLTSVENLTLLGSNNLNGTGNRRTNVLTGNSGKNSLSGGDGNDTLNGGAGTDNLAGGAGNDTYVVNTASDTLTETAPGGTDLVQSTATSYTLPNHVENLTLLGTGNINGTGNAEINVITGNAGSNDLNGGGGNDVLKGLAGADALRGGSGADRFDFDSAAEIGNSNATRDRISDFSHAQGDRIDLSTIDANGSGAGNTAFTFIGGGAFSGNSTGKLRFDAATHTLQGSTDADTAAEFSILLPNLGSMVVGDFIL